MGMSLFTQGAILRLKDRKLQLKKRGRLMGKGVFPAASIDYARRMDPNPSLLFNETPNLRA